MSRLRLGIDLDGVVADFNTGWITRYNEDFAAEIPFDAVTFWDGLHSLTHFEDMGGFWRWASDHGGGSLFRHLDTYDDAVPALDRLAKRHDIVILTTKPRWAIHDTFAWIAEHRIPTREVHILEKKWTVACDVYLDDAPHQVEAIHAARPDAVTVRFVRPWNEPVEGTSEVRSWAEFQDLVERLASPSS
jgi:5'(3')-deoxyribonucleotidase